MSEPEPLMQLDQQILDGEKLLGHLRNLIDEAASPEEKKALRREVRLTEPDWNYMKRRRSALLTKWWADIAGQPMPAHDETAATNQMAERFRELWMKRGGEAA